MAMKYDIAIIGGGIVGLATAYQLSKEFSHLYIAVIEKEKSAIFVEDYSQFKTFLLNF